MFRKDHYEKYHSEDNISLKVIKETNFTYINVLNVLKEYVSGGNLDILDLGCGVGTLSFFMASKGNKVLGVDLSDKAITIAKKSSKLIGFFDEIEFKSKKIEQIKTDRKFDLILASEILEHTLDDEFVLKKINSFLEPAGFLILTVPSLNAPLYRYGMLDKFDFLVGHLRRYSIASLKHKLIRNHFKVIQLHRREGIIRNLLFTHKRLSFLVKFLKGHLSVLVNYIDNLTVKYLGESQLIFVCQKEREIK